MGTIVDFPDRSEVAREAAEWLIRLDGDRQPTQDELTALGEWLQRNPVHREELENLAALWGRMNILTELAVPLGHASRPKRRLAWRRRTSLIAAAIATTLVLV